VTLLKRLGRWRLLRWMLLPLVAVGVLVWRSWRRQRLEAARYEATARVLTAKLDLDEETRRADAQAEVARDSVRAAHAAAVGQLEQSKRRIDDLNRETLATELNRVFGRSSTGGALP
jgi:hypothetical protein